MTRTRYPAPPPRVRISLLDAASGWLNSKALGPADLRGRVVLVNFWALTCINWLRQEPYVRAWSQGYRDDGLVVLGIHSPEFSFEQQLDRVRWAVQERGVDYPVALDNDFAIWRAFGNRYSVVGRWTIGRENLTLDEA